MPDTPDTSGVFIRDNHHEAVPPAQSTVVTTLHPVGPRTDVERLREIGHKVGQVLAHVVELGGDVPEAEAAIAQLLTRANDLVLLTASLHTEHVADLRETLVASLIELHPEHADAIRGSKGA